jgi:hypothetical protein
VEKDFVERTHEPTRGDPSLRLAGAGNFPQDMRHHQAGCCIAIGGAHGESRHDQVESGFDGSSSIHVKRDADRRRCIDRRGVFPARSPSMSIFESEARISSNATTLNAVAGVSRHHWVAGGRSRSCCLVAVDTASRSALLLMSFKIGSLDKALVRAEDRARKLRRILIS